MALALGGAVSYVLMEPLLDMASTYHIPRNLSSVMISVLLLIGVLLAVISTQIGKVYRNNPVDGLSVE